MILPLSAIAPRSCLTDAGMVVLIASTACECMADFIFLPLHRDVVHEQGARAVQH